VKEDVPIEGIYSNLLCEKINLKTVKNLVDISKFRDEYYNTFQELRTIYGSIFKYICLFAVQKSEVMHPDE
jgi:hypothetical protein